MPADPSAPRVAGRSESIALSPSLHWSGAGRLVAGLGTAGGSKRPLAVEISYARSGQKLRKVLGVTMRTPGQARGARPRVSPGGGD